MLDIGLHVDFPAVSNMVAYQTDMTDCILRPCVASHPRYAFELRTVQVIKRTVPVVENVSMGRIGAEAKEAVRIQGLRSAFMKCERYASVIVPNFLPEQHE
jgi:hypothetical protein